MRHFEEYEIEHLLNSTGSWFLRFRCKHHLKHCELCRQRCEKIKEKELVAQKICDAVRALEKFRSSDGASQLPEQDK